MPGIFIKHSAQAVLKATRPLPKRLICSRVVSQVSACEAKVAPKFTQPKCPMQLFKSKKNDHQPFNRNRSLPILFGLGVLGALVQREPAACEAETSTAMASEPWAAVTEKYCQELVEEEKNLIRSLCDILNITFTEWENLKREHVGSYNANVAEVIQYDIAHYTSVSDYYKSMVNDLLIKCGINPELVTLVRSEEMEDACDADAAVMGNFMGAGAIIFLNETILQSQFGKDKNIRATITILHEIQHLKNDDTFIHWLKYNVFNHEKYADPKMATWFNDYLKFAEKRADILAGLINPVYAKAMADLDMYRYYGNPMSAETHPSDEARVKYMGKLYQEMMACITVSVTVSTSYRA